MIIQNLAQLWECGLSSRKISRVNLDEGFYLMDYCQRRRPKVVVEIGTKHAGTTFLLWMTNPQAKVITIDNKSEEHPIIVENPDFLEQVEFVNADSHTYPNEHLSVDFLFIDGGHDYDQVKADFLHWEDRIAPDGTVIFHDAKEGNRPGVERFMDELRRDSNRRGKWTEFVPLPSTLVQFRRIEHESLES